jgi:3-oxoacyl-(acyl-carrier-protein) synthase
VRTSERPDLILDSRLVTVTLLAALAVAVPAALVAGLLDGRDAAYGALWGVGSVGVNGVAAAWVSARTARSRRQIGPGTVLMAIPVRIALLAAALGVAVGPLGLPATAVALAVCVGETCVVFAQSWVVMHGPTFVGPLD